MIIARFTNLLVKKNLLNLILFHHYYNCNLYSKDNVNFFRCNFLMAFNMDFVPTLVIVFPKSILISRVVIFYYVSINYAKISASLSEKKLLTLNDNKIIIYPLFQVKECNYKLFNEFIMLI